jgi:hypothetical protein
MNWADVSMLLNGQGEVWVSGVPLGATPLSKSPNLSVQFIGDVEADTDTTNINATTFMLHGPARIGLDGKTVEYLFEQAKAYCKLRNISNDPVTWVLLSHKDLDAQDRRGVDMLDVIASDEQLTEDFMVGIPRARQVKCTVTISYTPR